MKKQNKPNLFEVFDHKMSELLTGSSAYDSFKAAPVAFTQSELQFLKTFLAEELKFLDTFKENFKSDIDWYWDGSEKGTVKGESCFKCLNRAKNNLRKEKIKQKKLIAIQQKIKALLKTL